MGGFGAVLHAHTEFSARDSLIRVTELPQLAAERGWGACAITDHGAIEGAYYFVENCRKVGIQPIVGCELYVSPDIDEDLDQIERIGEEPDPSASRKARHLTVLVKNARGFVSLSKVLTMAHNLGWDAKRKRAVAPLKVVLNNLRDCVILSGCASSPFWRGGAKAARDLSAFAEQFSEDFFFECQALYDWNDQIILNSQIEEVAKTYGRPLVVTPDCHFAHKDDTKIHEALLSIASYPFRPVGHPNAWRFSTRLNHLMGPEEIVAALIKTGYDEEVAVGALAATELVRERIERWSWDDLPAPELPEIEGNMRVIVEEQLRARGLSADPVYQDRLAEELRVFEGAGLGRYLLLVRDCLNTFRAAGAEIGPRGSVGGSLVGYLMGLATLDPVAHGLPWQRFYAPGRKGWPDVDIDVDTPFREKVPEILAARFGERSVAQISNYMTFAPKSAIRQAARAFEVPLYGGKDEWGEEPEDKADLGDITKYELFEKLRDLNPKAAEFAEKLVDRVNGYGTHAGGFVITAGEVSEYRGAVVHRGKSKALVWDKDITEALGYVKLDFLGNDSLTALREIDVSNTVDWSKMTFDDVKVFEDFAEGRTAGLPQFLTSGLRTFVEMLRPERFEDLVWANAAYRPGGLGTMGPRQLVASYRSDPGSVIVYQEDVMQLCVDLAGFTWGEADAVRKVVAKSKGAAEFQKWTSRFVEGCVKTGSLSAEDAAAFWDTLSEFGRYSFNKAHAASYAWNGYRLAWAKRHHSAVTFAALLNASPDNAEAIVDDAEDFGVEVRPGHFNFSTLAWTVESETAIRAPLTRILGVDTRVSKAVLKRRNDGGKFKDYRDFEKRMAKIKYDRGILVAGFEESSRTPFMADLKAPGETGLTPSLYSQEVRACAQCDFRANCRAPVPPEWGESNVLIVGEAPGKNEDRRGRPFVGDSGDLMNGILAKFGVERSDVTWTNSVQCKPPYIEGAKGWEDPGCPWLSDMIGKMLPPLVLALGRRAWHKLGGDGGIMKANASVRLGLPVIVPAVHPAAVLRDISLLPELERAVRKFARLFRELKNPKPATAPPLPAPPVAPVQTTLGFASDPEPARTIETPTDPIPDSGPDDIPF